MSLKQSALLSLALVALPLVALGAQGVTTSGPDSLFMRLSSSQRAMVTRAELKKSLGEIDEILASSGYSAALKQQKRAEAAVIKRRLSEGDIRPGDVITLAVANYSGNGINGSYTVTPERTIIPPDTGPIYVGGLLRSEVEDYLRKEMRKYVRDPLVRAQANIRIALFGGVNRQGFFVVPASSLLTDVIMSQNGGNGPSGNQKLKDSVILRGDTVIVDKEQFQTALREAKSLDELNLQAGDEIKVGERRSGRTPILAYIGVASSLTYLFVRIF